jgi:hypothetical protein
MRTIVEPTLRQVTFTVTYYGIEKGKEVTPRTTNIGELAIDCKDLPKSLQELLRGIVEKSYRQQFHPAKRLRAKLVELQKKERGW